MATASPTPFGTSTRMPLRIVRTNAHDKAGGDGLSRAYATKETSISKRASPAAQVAARNLGVNVSDEDSSDEEGSAPPILSAVAEEILGGKSGGSKPSSGTRANHVRNHAEYASGSPVALAMRDREREKHLARQRTKSPEVVATTSPSEKPHRIVRISTSPGSALRKRTTSVEFEDGVARSPVEKAIGRDYKTPAPRPRSFLADEEEDVHGGAERHESVEPRSNHYSSGKSRGNISSADARDVANPARVPGASSIRIKRVQQGTLLGGRARRGMYRRPSEEDQSPLSRSRPSGEERHSSAEPESRLHGSPVQDHVPSKVHFTGSDERPKSRDDHEKPPRREHEIPSEVQPSARPTSSQHKGIDVEPERREHKPSQSNKENEPPSMLGSHRPSPVNVFADNPVKPIVSSISKPVPVSEQRPILASKTTNTPLRPAPPPPKMNVVDAATAAAGAMAAKQRKASNKLPPSMTVNGRKYQRFDCIGRGGSGKVFRVMAANDKLYACKRVSLEGMDEMAIRGFKGEIDLLTRLKGVDRVVGLIDFEINDEKQTLSVLMEMGELDLQKLLAPRLDESTGKFDITFTRYIWREMLECVKAVHEHDVVHSDLKPANFVMVLGRLKLIDFGIANAIADDTVNVHREMLIGTPNYMAPEALIDTNAHDRAMSSGKLMKLGKPSDVWSLACILYQIVYGKPPFGHLTNQHAKTSAIVNHRHVISFPEIGLGGVQVPIGLQRTLKRCLNRDQRQRPSIEELLSDRDPFLHPDAPGLLPLSENLLGMIQKKMVEAVQRQSHPSEAELAVWQANMFENVRTAIRDGKIVV